MKEFSINSIPSSLRFSPGNDCGLFESCVKIHSWKLPMTMPMKRSNASTRKQQVLNTGIRGMRCSGDMVVLGPGLEESKSISKARNRIEHKQRCSNTPVDSFGYSQNTRKMMHSSNNHLIGSLSRLIWIQVQLVWPVFHSTPTSFGRFPVPECQPKCWCFRNLRRMKLQWFNH